MTGESTSRLLTGWGRATASMAWVAGPLTIERLRELVLSHPAGGVAARGAGLSYGDAALNAGGYVLSPVTRPQIDLTADAASVRATASVSFAELLSVTVPHGLILPVLPGTRSLTVGGAIAADDPAAFHATVGGMGLTGIILADPMPDREESGLVYQTARARRAPAVPFCPVTPWSAKAFNSLGSGRRPGARAGSPICRVTYTGWTR